MREWPAAEWEMLCEGMEALAAVQGKYAPVIRAILKSAWGGRFLYLALPASSSCPVLPSLIPSALLLNLPLFFQPPRLLPALQFVHFQPHCYSGAFQQLSDIRKHTGDQSSPRVQGGELQGQLVKSFHF